MATCLNSKRILRPARMLNSITLVDVMCPVCRGIFIEPVTLPCHHGLCLKCFERSMEESSLACPMCRKRVGGWLRTATKDGNLVNIKLWSLIQQRFPKEVQAKMNGEDDGVEDRVVNSSTPRVRISSPGEIRQEFAFQLHQLQEENKRRQEAEWRASCDLIRKLHEEEKEQLQRQQQQQLQDEQMARQLHSTMMQSSSTAPSNNIQQQQQQPPPQQQPPQQSSSFSDIEVKKGPLDFFFSSGSFHKKIIEANRATDTPECSSEQARSSSNLSTGSQDSITQEMLHFKPIKVVPRTPPKRLPDGQVVEPRLVKATPLNLNRTYEALEGADVEALLSPASRLRLGLCQPECTLPQPSAFRASASTLGPAPLAWALNKVCAAGYPCVGVGGARSSAGLEEAEAETPTKRPRLAPQHPDQRRPGDPQPDSTEESSAETAETPASPAHTDATETDINMGVLRLSPASGPHPSGSADSSHSADLHTKVGFLNIVPGDEAASSSAGAASSSASSAASAASGHGKGSGSQRSSLMDVDGVASSPRAMDVEEDLDDVQEDEEEDEEEQEQGQEQRHTAALLLLAQEQARAEALLRQERADLELARRLQSEWELADQRIDRSRGSGNPYGLRRKPPPQASDSLTAATSSCSGPTASASAARGSKAAKAGRSIRQRTLEETLTPRRRSGRN